MKPFAFTYIFLSSLLLTDLASAKKIDILEIYNRFYLTQSLAQKCGQPDKGMVRKFSKNFSIVKIRAEERVQEMRTDFSAQQVQSSFKTMNGRLDKIVAAVTCKSPQAEQLMKLYEFHANWDMRNKLR